MIRISANDIRLKKKDAYIIKQVNDIITQAFKNISLEQSEIRIFFVEEEEYYRNLGFYKPYRNLVITDGYYDKKYQEIFIRENSSSLIRAYIHEIGHFIDYNLKVHNQVFKVGSAFYRKILEDMSFEDQVLNDVKSMPAYSLLNVASKSSYLFSADEIFARFFEVFIWEKLGRKYFTPDLYIKTPKLFLFLNNWLAKKPDSILYKPFAKLHFYILNKSITKRKVHDPFKRDRFSKYIEELKNA